MTFTKTRWILAALVAALLLGAAVLELSWLIAVAAVMVAVVLSGQQRRDRRRGATARPEEAGR